MLPVHVLCAIPLAEGRRVSENLRPEEAELAWKQIGSSNRLCPLRVSSLGTAVSGLSLYRTNLGAGLTPAPEEALAQRERQEGA